MSIAGKRDGLDGSRSSLFYEAIRIVKEMRCKTNGEKPRFIVWENVPGAFSSNKGQDFKAVLEAVIGVKESSAEVPAPAKKGWPDADYYVGDGWSVAYRVLDAQWWGVPQRRKRIYLVADFAGASAPKVLFESEGVSRYRFMLELDQDYDFIASGFYYDRNGSISPYFIDNTAVYEGNLLKELRNTYLYSEQSGKISQQIFFARWNKLYKAKTVRTAIEAFEQCKGITLGEDKAVYIAISEVQRERVFQKTILLGLCDLTYSVPNPVKPSAVDESFIRCHGWLGHLGDRERRAETDHRVYRERNHDGAIFKHSDVDIRRKDRKRLEEDTVL